MAGSTSLADLKVPDHELYYPDPNPTIPDYEKTAHALRRWNSEKDFKKDFAHAKKLATKPPSASTSSSAKKTSGANKSSGGKESSGVRAYPWYPLIVLVEEAFFLLDAVRDAATVVRRRVEVGRRRAANLINRGFRSLVQGF